MNRSLWIAVMGLIFCAAGCEDDNHAVTQQEEEKPGEGEKPGNCTKGERTCLEIDIAGVCRTGDGGMTEWVSEPCGSGAKCEKGRCVKDDEVKEPGCEDECPVYGEFDCAGGSAFRKCSNFDDDPCLEWSAPQPCEEGEFCEAGKCVADGAACTHACDAGASECIDGGYRTCVNGADGCRVWSDVTECANGCENGACIAGAQCSHQCETGAAQCEGGGIKTCTAGADGCRVWTEVTACEYGCENNRCKDRPACDHKCDAGAAECSGDGFRTCTSDADGCRIWSKVTKCDYGCAGGKCKEKPAPVMAKTRYPGDRILSPVTPYVVKSMQDIRAKNSARADDHFMKMGDSHMYSESSFMYCFSQNSSKHDGYNLNGLPFDGAAANFQKSFDSFNRVSGITILGKTALLPINNNFSGLNAELNVTNPRFAFYGFGTNDMGWFGYNKLAGSNQGYFYTLQWYYRNVLKTVRKLIGSGVIPMIIGTGWRTDKPVSSEQDRPIHYVTTYNAISRGIAEYYQIPYYDLQLSHTPLADHGLSGDGIHHRTIHNGCDFTDNGLTAGANRRNRYAIEMLDRAWRTLIKGEAAPDNIVPFEGRGTHAEPFVITGLPYTNMATTKGGEKKFGRYSCANVSEDGPEHVYKLTVKTAVKIRAFAMSDENVDADIHLLSSLSASACIARGDKWVEASLQPGTYYFVVDTFENDAKAGIYLFGIHACDADDAACGSKNTGA